MPSSNYKKKIVFIIIFVFIILISLLIIFNLKKENEKTISLKNTSEDFSQMIEISTKFINYYFNYNNQSLKNGVWKKNLYPYIDKKEVKKYKNNDLYKKIYDKEWQISHIVNDNTISEIISIDSINTFYSENDAYIEAKVTLRKNGNDDVSSPYFQMIQIIEELYIIDFTSENKIYSVKCSKQVILNPGNNYYNK